MEEFKGTQGKWISRGYSYPSIDFISEDGNIRNIATLNISLVPIEERVANAQLIAAAPELLNACIEALKYVSCEEPAFDILNNAIAKALGKEIKNEK